jgi:hypothetical protein
MTQPRRRTLEDKGDRRVEDTVADSFPASDPPLRIPASPMSAAATTRKDLSPWMQCRRRTGVGRMPDGMANRPA